MKFTFFFNHEKPIRHLPQVHALRSAESLAQHSLQEHQQQRDEAQEELAARRLPTGGQAT